MTMTLSETEVKRLRAPGWLLLHKQMVKLLVLGLMYGMIVVDEAMLQARPKGKELVLLQKAEPVPKQKQE